MSHIVIDARESGTSTGRYVDKLIEHLHAIKPQHNITLLTKPHRLDYMAQMAPGFKAIESPYKEFTLQEQLGLYKQISGLSPDLVHFAKDHQPVLYRKPKVTTMHDLTTMRFTNPDKNLFVYKFKQLVYKQIVKHAARTSKAVMTPAEFVKQDVIDYTGVPADKITVTYEAADQLPAAEPVTNLTNKRFIMYVGRPTPHKNLGRLIEAFKLLKGQYPDLHLVLAGKMDKNYRDHQQKVQAEQIANIVFTDFISDGQLRWLYENCDAYVFPSLSEGFGLPGLEAMIHGAPVVSSDATCLPEIYGEAAHYFDPLDIQAMADAINEVLSDKQLRQGLIERGHTQAGKYSWRRMAEETLAVYDQVLNR